MRAGRLHQPTGQNTALVVTGTTTDPALAAAILANPENYYVDVHTTTCTGGADPGTDRVVTPISDASRRRAWRNGWTVGRDRCLHRHGRAKF